MTGIAPAEGGLITGVFVPTDGDGAITPLFGIDPTPPPLASGLRGATTSGTCA